MGKLLNWFNGGSARTVYVKHKAAHALGGPFRPGDVAWTAVPPAVLYFLMR